LIFSEASTESPIKSQSLAAAMSDASTQEIRAILTQILKVHHEAILCTADENGRPHAAWMGVFCSHDFRYLITVTSAQSDKVDNIRHNPHVEWMLTSADRSTIIYFEGEAEALVDEDLKEQYLQGVPEESRQFFMKYYRKGGQCQVIRTRLDNVVYCMPGAYDKVRLSMVHVRS
jgi:general stress protein 26